MTQPNRTPKGVNREAEIQSKYEEWWLDKLVDYPQTVDGIPAKGRIINVRYIGNSHYGSVELMLDNGCRFFAPCPDGSFRPTKKDFEKYLVYERDYDEN